MPTQVFHKMDSMLKDATYHGELEELRRNAVDAPPAEAGAGAGAGAGGSAPGDAGEEDSQVSTSEALDMLRQARALRCVLPPGPVLLAGALSPCSCLRTASCLVSPLLAHAPLHDRASSSRTRGEKNRSREEEREKKRRCHH